MPSGEIMAGAALEREICMAQRSFRGGVELMLPPEQKSCTAAADRALLRHTVYRNLQSLTSQRKTAVWICLLQKELRKKRKIHENSIIPFSVGVPPTTTWRPLIRIPAEKILFRNIFPPARWLAHKISGKHCPQALWTVIWSRRALRAEAGAAVPPRASRR